MDPAVKELYNFIRENPGKEPLEPGAIENWFVLIRNNNAANTTEPEKAQGFRLLTEGMEADFQKEGFCNAPGLLDEIRQTAGNYIRDTETATRPAPVFKPKRARNGVMINTAISQKLPEIINAGAQEIVTGGTAKNPMIETATATIAPREIKGVKIDGDYNEPVFTAFISLWLAGNEVITAEMIQRFLSQNYKTKEIAQSTIEDITAAIEDLRRLHIQADITEEARRRKWTDIDNLQICHGSMMLMLEDIPLTFNGKTKTGYALIRTPLLYEHALLSGQLITFPVSLLVVKDRETGKTLKTTENRTAIQFYLIRQIENNKNDIAAANEKLRKYNYRRKNDPTLPEKKQSDFRKMNSRISYKTVFEKTGLSGKQNKELLDYESYIKNCLASWKDAGRLYGFTTLHTARRKDKETGVFLILEKK